MKNINMDRFNFCVIWLKVISVLFSLFGIVIALFNQTQLFQIVFNNQINPTFFGSNDLSIEALRFQQWIYGLLGATCLMDGILIFFIVQNAFAKKEKWAWYCVLIGLIAWFAIDEPISLYFHVYFNAIFNLALLIAILVPICLTYRDFKN